MTSKTLTKFSFSFQPDYEVLKKTCNLWRNWVDIEDSYESVNLIGDYFIQNQDRLIPHAGPGHWHDPGKMFKVVLIFFYVILIF